MVWIMVWSTKSTDGLMGRKRAGIGRSRLLIAAAESSQGEKGGL